MAANSFQSYALALLTLARNQEDVNDNPSLRIATRRDGTDDSSFNMPAAHNLLRLLIEHSPSPESMARLFMVELARCKIPAVKNLGNVVLSALHDTTSHIKYYMQVKTLNSSDRSVSPGDWAIAVREEIRHTGIIMKPLTDFASFSLICVIGCRLQCNLH
jgi:hypothetical protein